MLIEDFIIPEKTTLKSIYINKYEDMYYHMQKMLIMHHLLVKLNF